MRFHAVLMGSLAASWLVFLTGCVGDPDVDFPESDEVFEPTEPIVDGPLGLGESGPGESDRPQIIINEIMYNPRIVSDEFGEWLELHNAGDEAVDLLGWALRDYGNNRHVIDETIIVDAGDYVVLGRNCDPEQNGGYVADYCYGDEFKLANDPGDGIELRDHEGTYVDSVSYDTHEPWPHNTPGVSIELTNPRADNLDPLSWSLASTSFGDGDLGTPGLPNSQ